MNESPVPEREWRAVERILGLESMAQLMGMVGDRESWRKCQIEADRLRSRGASGLTASSAALRSGGAHGWRVDGVQKPGPARDGKVFALFGQRPDLVGWPATVAGRPDENLLGRVRHF